MKRLLLTLSAVTCTMMPLAAQTTEWALDRGPAPIWAQPGEVLRLNFTGPADSGGKISVGGGAAAPLVTSGSREYSARLLAPASGQGNLTVTDSKGQRHDLGAFETWSGVKTLTVKSPLVTRQGPDSDYERLTPLLPGTVVEVDGRRGDWYRSAASGAWLDGRSGVISDGAAAPSALSGVKIGSFPNGDARLLLSCGTRPEARVEMVGERVLRLTLPATDDLIFEATKESSAANFLGPVTVRPLTPGGVVIEIALSEHGLGGYELSAGEMLGDLVLRVRQPVPKTLRGLVVTLDAGHGGPKDPGTVGHGDLPEKVLNLRVTEALERMLRERGATVLMTRTSDADVAPDDEGASHELQARIDMSVEKEAHLFLSLHHNARPSVEEGKISHGTDIYWYQPFSEPLGRALADPIADAIEEPLRTSRFRSFHVIRQTFSPSVLIEFQYLSNPTLEKSVLDRSDYPERAAGGVVRGLEAYLKALP